MSRLRVVIVTLCMLLCSSFAAADTINDPSISIGGSSAVGFGIFQTTFFFTSPSGTSPGNLPGGSPCIGGVHVAVANCVFLNLTGQSIASITIEPMSAPGPGPFSCFAGGPFTNCTVSPDGTSFVFSGGTGIPTQYPPNRSFQISVVGWQPGECFNVFLTPGTPSVPEPATLLLFGTGLLSLGGFVRRRLRR